MKLPPSSFSALLLVLASACSVETSGLAGADGGAAADTGPGEIDGGTDARVPPTDAGDGGGGEADAAAVDAGGGCGWGYTPAYFDACEPHGDEEVLDLAGPERWVFDTSDGTLSYDDDDATTPESTVQGGVRVLWVSGLVVRDDTTLRVVGSLPLVIASAGDIEVLGEIDAASREDGAAGAGANAADCSAPEPGSTCDQHGGSGGGGGGFGGAGGAGGEGGDGHTCGATDGKPGGAGGLAAGATPIGLRGGCPGAAGAPNNDSGSRPGDGGDGGGAIHLAAAGRLQIEGHVVAGGAGGDPGEDARAGGGGGGSGGMIGLEGATIEIASGAVVAANGGGGGGGCEDGAAEPGSDGLGEASPAPGGDGQKAGTAGGNGGYRDSLGGDSAAVAARGGGGGGGGAGFVVLHAHGPFTIPADAVISPGYVVP